MPPAIDRPPQFNNVIPPGPGAALPPGGVPPLAATPQAYGMAPTPQVAPAAQPFGYAPPNPGTFTGSAPTATPYGDFTAPDPTKMAADPYYQFRLAQGQKGLERGAAARGTLLSGGAAKALQAFGQDSASAEGANIYNRALQTYGTNRDTNAQNFGQQMGSFTGNLNAFNANTDATLGAGRLGLESATAGYDRNYGAAQDQARVTNANTGAMDAYAQQLEAQRAAMPVVPEQTPLGRLRGGSLGARSAGFR